MQIYEQELDRLKAEVALARSGEVEVAGKLAVIEVEAAAALRVKPQAGVEAVTLQAGERRRGRLLTGNWMGNDGTIVRWDDGTMGSAAPLIDHHFK